jgi:hypothetical protein
MFFSCQRPSANNKGEIAGEEILNMFGHCSSAMTIVLYTLSPMERRIEPQESVLRAILKQPARRARSRMDRRRARYGLKTGLRKRWGEHDGAA